MNNPEAFKEDEVRSIKFVVPGLPFGKQRPKVTVRKFTGSDGKEKKFAKAYTPEKTVNYENLVKMAYQEKAKGKKFKDGDMLDVRIIAYYNIPPSTSKKRRTMMLEHKIRPTKKPDWDNIGKIVCDSLNNIAYHDDNQVVDAQVRKFFSENPRVEVTIRKGGRVMAGEEKQIVVEETTVVPGKMEFRLISPTESNFLKHIEWNKEELLAAVRSKVALYEGIVYTEETVKTAKNDRAELNNLVKAIDERRKKVKEVINQPYAEFEKELKEITDLIKKQSAEIDEQVKAFETAEKEEKRAKIMEAYEKAVGNLAEILPFSKVSISGI